MQSVIFDVVIVHNLLDEMNDARCSAGASVLLQAIDPSEYTAEDWWRHAAGNIAYDIEDGAAGRPMWAPQLGGAVPSSLARTHMKVGRTRTLGLAGA
jgi:hypothetical protein